MQVNRHLRMGMHNCWLEATIYPSDWIPQTLTSRQRHHIVVYIRMWMAVVIVVYICPHASGYHMHAYTIITATIHICEWIPHAVDIYKPLSQLPSTYEYKPLSQLPSTYEWRCIYPIITATIHICEWIPHASGHIIPLSQLPSTCEWTYYTIITTAIHICEWIPHSEGFCVARLLHYDNRETPLAGNLVGRCQGHKSDISTQSWVLISEKDNVTISGRCLYTHEWRELVTGGEVRNGMEKIMAIII